jgi:hypothetical protein
MLHSNDARIEKRDDTVSALTLFVARILADDAHHAFTADYLAIAADPLDRRQYFHFDDS